jgi:diamine N-acetyltransferase
VHLGLVAIVVREYDPAIEFFVGKLGFELAEDSPSLTNDGRPKRWVVVRPPGAETGLLLAQADGPGQAAAVGQHAGGRVGLFLRVDDFGEAHGRMSAAGVQFVTQPRSEPYGDVAVFLDIAGNKWDLIGPPGEPAASAVSLEAITEANREQALALRLAPGQEQFVGSVPDSLAEAAEYPQAKPWYRVARVGGELVGFVMLSWDVTPAPPEIIGPWFLWKLLIDERHQGRGYGRDVVRQIAELVRAQGAAELLTSYVPGDGGPAGFYQRLGFEPTGELDANGEVILRLRLA